MQQVLIAYASFEFVCVTLEGQNRQMIFIDILAFDLVLISIVVSFGVVSRPSWAWIIFKAKTTSVIVQHLPLLFSAFLWSRFWYG